MRVACVRVGGSDDERALDGGVRSDGPGGSKGHGERGEERTGGKLSRRRAILISTPRLAQIRHDRHAEWFAISSHSLALAAGPPRSPHGCSDSRLDLAPNSCDNKTSRGRLLSGISGESHGGCESLSSRSTPHVNLGVDRARHPRVSSLETDRPICVPWTIASTIRPCYPLSEVVKCAEDSGKRASLTEVDASERDVQRALRALRVPNFRPSCLAGVRAKLRCDFLTTHGAVR